MKAFILANDFLKIKATSLTPQAFLITNIYQKFQTLVAAFENFLRVLEFPPHTSLVAVEDHNA